MKGISKGWIMLVIMLAIALFLVSAVSGVINGVEFNNATRTAVIKAGGINLSEVQLVAYDNTSSITNAWFEYRFKTYIPFTVPASFSGTYGWGTIIDTGKNMSISFELYEKINQTFAFVSCNPFNSTLPNGSIITAENCTSLPITSETERRSPFSFYGYSFKPDRDYKIRVNAYREPSTGRQKGDILPTIGGFSIPQFAWFDNNWAQCINLTLEEIAGFARTEEPVTIRVNLTGTNVAASGIDIRIVNQSCNNGGSQIDHDVYRIAGQNYTLRFLANASANANNTFAIYINNSGASNLTKVTDIINRSLLIENKYFNVTIGGAAITEYKIKQGGIEGANLVGPTGFAVLSVNATNTLSNAAGDSCSIIGNGSFYFEINCTSTNAGETQYSMFHTFWARQRWFQTHIGTPTRDAALSYQFRYGDLSSAVWRFNASVRATGSAEQGNLTVRGILGDWDNSAGANNMTGLLYNTSQYITAQTEYENFIAGGLDANLMCAGIGCNVASPYRSNGSYLYETDFRFVSNTGPTTDASRIGYLTTQWEIFMSPLESRVRLGTAAQNLSQTPAILTILDPGNTTFGALNRSLNVTADQTIGLWQYALNSGGRVNFSPNTTFLAITGTNNLTIYGNNSFGLNSSTSVNFTIGVAPTIFFLTINTDSARTNDSINVSVLYNDSGADAGTLNFTWYRNGVNVQNNTINVANNTNMTAISTFKFIGFDNISIRAVANDSQGVSNVLNTTNFTATNTPATLFGITILPNPAYINSTLNVSMLYNDSDGHAGTIVLYWMQNGINVQNSTFSGIANNTNVTAIDSITLGRFDNWSVRVTANDSSPVFNLSTTNLTLSPSFVFRSTLVNRVYFDVNRNLTVRLRITNDSGIILSTARLEFNSSNFSMTRVNSTEYFMDINLSQRNLSDSNITIRFFADDSVGNETNASAATSMIYDNTAPVITLSKITAGDGFLLPLSLNITANTTEPFISFLNVSVYNGGSSFNFSFRYAANTSVEINFTGSNPVGNYSVNLTVNDTGGHNTTTRFFVGMGNINRTIQLRLVSLNFTTEPSAWGFSSALVNNSRQNLTLRMNITIVADGNLDARTRRIEINRTEYFTNWTTTVARDSALGLLPIINSTDIANFTTEDISTGENITEYLDVLSLNAVNFTLLRQTDSSYRFMVESFLADNVSFNEFLRFALPTTMIFEKTLSHPRYFICTGTITPSSFGCSVFTTATDVTVSNSGSNSIAGYPINMKAYDATNSISELSMQANQSAFLVEVSIVSGAFQAGSGGGGAPSVGGGGAPTIITPEAIIEALSPCPTGYNLSSNGIECLLIPSPIAGFELGILGREVFMGLTVFHFMIILGVISVVASPQIRKRIRRSR